jgi:hypothetical protein
LLEADAMPHYIHDEIVVYHADMTNSLIRYITDIVAGRAFDAQYVGLTLSEMDDVKKKRLEELEYQSCLALLAAIEALFRVDYNNRVAYRFRDAVSRDFRALDKKVRRRKAPRPWFSAELLAVWKKHLTGNARQCIIQVENAFNYRHWLAHGRYWTPKYGTFPTFYDLWIIDQQLQSIIQQYA